MPGRMAPPEAPADLRRQADRQMIRAMRFLQLAERHMQELSRLVDSPELDDQLQAVAELASAFERRLEQRLRG